MGKDEWMMNDALREDKVFLFERAPMLHAVAALAVPTVVSQLITTIYNLADAYFVGQLNDPGQLSAITLVLPVQLSLTALANLFGIGGGTMLSRLLGSKEHDKAKRISAFAFYSAMTVILLYSAMIAVFRAPFLRLLGATPALYGYVSAYVFWVAVLGGLPSVFNMVAAHLIRAEGASKEASLGLSMGGVINMMLDPVFIHVLGLQLKGAAVATFLSNCITSIYFILYLRRVRNKTVLSFSPRHFTLERSVAAPVLLIGLPSALQMLLSTVSNTVLNNTIVPFGESAVAAIGICKKVDSIPAYMLLGVTQGMVPLIAYNYGSGNLGRMRQGIRYTMGTVLSISLVFLAALEAIPHIITSWFIEDAATVAYAAVFIRIHCIALPFTAVTFLLMGVFQAMKKSRQATALSLIRKGIVDVPLMFLMNLLIPLYGPVMCQPIMDGVSAFCAIIMYLCLKKSREEAR